MHPLVITLDVEDWQQSTWDRSLPISSHAAKNVLHVLELLERLSTRATMFVQGKFAATFPHIVKKIHTCGHEISCHGFNHIEIFKQSRTEFKQDVLKAKKLLEDIIGDTVEGYRAPDFSIAPSTFWALDVLAELGFSYDASIFPIRASRYGIPSFPVVPVELILPTGAKIIEVPVGTWTAGKKNFPVAGGGYFRLLPGLVSRFFIGATLKRRPFVFYCHPYEFNPSEFKMLRISIPLRTRLHQGLGRRFFEARFTVLIKKFGGCSIKNMLDGMNLQPIVLEEMILE